MRDRAISELKIYQVNAFIEEGYQGNPAGVCLLPQERREDFYIKAAMKMALPETAFLYKKGESYQLRWFTPNGTEVDLCGHATLATSHILWDKGYVDSNTAISFNTRSGILSAELDGGLITLGFPLETVTEVKDNEHDLCRVLGLTPRYVGKTRFDYLIVAGSEESVKNLAPDFEKIKTIPARGIIVTAKSSSADYDYINRFFAPRVGINEDPVTGSAHTCLGVYWSAVLKKNPLVGYQASPEGGIVGVNTLKDRVLLSGRAREVPIPEALREAIVSLR